MKGPYGSEFSGWWLLLAVVAAVVVIAFIPHAPDLQYNGKP